MTTLSKILEHKIVVIIRGANPGDVLKIASALHEGGIRILEITFNSPNALSVVNELSTQMGEELLIGMGTVLDATTAKDAISAGAKFIISPTLNLKTIQATKKNGAVSIPGAFTATEILSAYEQGGDIIKVFPASVSPNYIRDLHGPFPQIPLMPTGGINIENIEEYLKAGSVAVGIGSALVDSKQEVTKEYLKQLTEKADEFVQIVTNILK
jgi:2-dehydro-3-deoxyphosphogluconate aldolase/(4S)-4-hydroxy-2-oxoglutarate aldolase